jgi:putative oxidoreductase
MNALWLLLARIGLSALFIVQGFYKLKDPTYVITQVTNKGFPMPTALGYGVALLEVVGGVAILIGFKARWAATALLLFTAATIVLFHNFWAMDGQAAAMNQLQALKNLGIMGGMLLLTQTGPGPYSADRG